MARAVRTFGELVVLCDLAGARTVHGNVLSRGTFNFSSTEARYRRARQLAEQSKAPELGWMQLLEEVCADVLAKQADGEPAGLLRDLPRPSPDAVLDVDSFRLLKQHPVVLFGDGGAAKSYLALFLAGRLAQRGLRVGVFDWELAGEDHRDRLERLFGANMPAVWYRSCRHPLIVELDSLRRLARRERLEYLVYDSVAFAAHDKPEAAESAISYFRATRQIGPGSLHVAHITKTEGGDQKPFGSTFWHNSARATYFVQRAAESPDGREVTIGVFNRKANLGRLQPAFGFRFTFDEDRTLVTRADVANVQDLADKLPLWQRIVPVVKAGPRTLVEIADALGAKVDTVTKAVTRSSLFTKVSSPDGITKIALVERRPS